MTLPFPISAVHKGDRIRQAISFGLISPDVHSILIRGPPGTGKSVAARGVSCITDLRIVEIPVGTTREQLLGSVDIEFAVREGRRKVSDSILSRADGGIMIADNVNLLSSDILLEILDSLERGYYHGEVGGITSEGGVDSLLVATMDPDEGDLGEHILDRFDICVDVEPMSFQEDRREVIRRVLDFERDPVSFSRRYSEDDDAIRVRIDRSDCISVEVPDGFHSMISAICTEMHTEGHRGDVAVLNVMRASAAFDGREVVNRNDLKRAVMLCLQHRRRDMPPEAESEPEPPEEPLEQPPDDESQDRDQPPDDQGEQVQSETQVSDGDGDGDSEEGDGGQASERTFAVGEQFDVTDYIPPESRGSRNRRSGRQDTSISKDGSGRAVGYIIPRGKVRDVALVASIRAAAPYQLTRDHHGLAVVLENGDLRERVRVRRKGTTVLFVVDGSGSMGAQNRMVAVKGAILSMLTDAYRRRDSVGLVIFRGDGAETVLPPTRSVQIACRSLEALPTGGRTPLSSGLREGYRILRRDAESGLEPVMVVLTDGKGNVGDGSDRPASQVLSETAGVIADSGIRTIVVDTEVGLVRFGKALDLAAMMESSYVQLEDLNAEHLSASVRSALSLFKDR